MRMFNDDYDDMTVMAEEWETRGFHRSELPDRETLLTLPCIEEILDDDTETIIFSEAAFSDLTAWSSDAIISDIGSFDGTEHGVGILEMKLEAERVAIDLATDKRRIDDLNAQIRALTGSDEPQDEPRTPTCDPPEKTFNFNTIKVEQQSRPRFVRHASG
jgi:hypothetical protein